MSATPIWMGDSPLSVRRRIKWGECDPAGVVYTPRAGDFVVEAFQDLLERLLEGPLQQKLAEHDLGTPAKALSLLFKRSMWPDQTIEMRVRIGGVRERSFDVAVDCVDAVEGVQIFSAVLGIVCVHHGVRQSRRIPAVLRERLCAYRDRFQVPQ